MREDARGRMEYVLENDNLLILKEIFFKDPDSVPDLDVRQFARTLRASSVGRGKSVL
jgi:hypothetical protein